VLQCVAVCCSVLQVLQYDLAPNLSIACVEGLWHITQILVPCVVMERYKRLVGSLLRADSRDTPTARGRKCRMSKKGQEESETRE